MKRNMSRPSTLTSRRSFAVASAMTAASYSRVLGANDRVQLGFIGVGNRGSNLLGMTKEFGDQNIAAVCDVYEPLLDRAATAAGTNPTRYRDFRKLLDNKEIDAVVIATPDHWHALMMIAACRAGKDVYVEKPLSLTVVEGRRMVEVAERTQRVVQVGIHRRSSPFCREAAEIVRSGEIGHVTAARCGVALNMFPAGIGAPPDAAPPSGLDWDLYLGPAPKVAYNANRHLFRFRWFFDYAAGQLTDNGVHFLDLINWALGENRPSSVTALGGKYVLEDNREVPDTLDVLWQYPGGALVSFTQSSANAAPWTGKPNLLAEFRGTKGTLYVDFGGWEIVPESNTDMPRPAQGPMSPGSSSAYRDSFRPVGEVRQGTGSADPRFHIRNFLDCIKSRAKPNCDVETAHRSTTVANIGAIAYRTRKHLAWDAEREEFTSDRAANALLHYDYRPPWTLEA